MLWKIAQLKISGNLTEESDFTKFADCPKKNSEISKLTITKPVITHFFEKSFWMLELTIFGLTPDSIFSKTTDYYLDKLNVYGMYILVSDGHGFFLTAQKIWMPDCWKITKTSITKAKLSFQGQTLLKHSKFSRWINWPTSKVGYKNL